MESSARGAPGKVNPSPSKVSSTGTFSLAKKAHGPFIISNTSGKADIAARRLIRSHVMTGKNRTKSLRLAVKLDPWTKSDTFSQWSSVLHPSPHLDISQAGFSLVQFADEMQPYMLELVFQFFTIIGPALFPSELCMDADLRNTVWFDYLYVDAAFLHSTLWATHNYLDMMSRVGPSKQSLLHESKTLTLLQHRLTQDTHKSVSDMTIAVVVILVLNTALAGHLNTAIRHMSGLARMVSMRGGLQAFKTNLQLQTKICRADLTISMATGKGPLFYSKENDNWSRILAATDDERWALPRELSTLAIEMRFADLWADLKCYTVLANLAFQTGRKLDPGFFQKVLTSIMYRAALLDVSAHPVLRVLHFGVLAFCSTVFLQPDKLKSRFDYLLKQLHSAICAANTSEQDGLQVVVLWSLVVTGLSAFANVDKEWILPELGSQIKGKRLNSWKEVRTILKMFLWIDALHEKEGRKLYESTVAKMSSKI